MDNPMSWIFAAITLAGLGYFAFIIIGGELSDGMGDSEFSGLLISAFAAGFGAFGLLGTLSQWPTWVTVLAAIGFGYGLGKFGTTVLKAVLRQQTEGSITPVDDLVGLSGRATIDSPAGKTGEVILDDTPHITRIAAKEVSGAALKRGDVVQVVCAESGLLYVKKKNG